MSYNIDHVECTVLDAWMYAKDIVEFESDLYYLPEDTFLEDIAAAAHNALIKGKPKTRIQLRGMQWRGEGSGSTFEDTFVKQIAPKIMGHVEAVCTWEGGDSTSAFVIEDGAYEECDVKTTIVRRKKAKK